MSTIERLPLTVDHLPEEKRAVYDAEPILSARDLVITFGRVIGLDGVNVDLYRGEVLAVIGDNGAGKSTLIKCLTGAYQQDSGRSTSRVSRSTSSARRTPARPASRRSTSSWPSSRRSTSRATSTSPARSAGRARSARCCGCSTRRA